MLFLANWKMYLSAAQSVALAKVAVGAKPQEAEVVLFPDFASLGATQQVLAGTDVMLGAQDCFWETQGAHTGEVSPHALVEAGCRYVLLGHSERRAMGETDAMVKKKLHAALAAGLIPVICVGEPYEARQEEMHEAYVKAQLEAVLHEMPLERGHHLVFAYEPVWAISASRHGGDITPEQIGEMVNYIHVFLKEHFTDDPAVWSVVYGGSVNAENIREVLAVSGVAGVLVGKASSEEEEMRGILASL